MNYNDIEPASEARIAQMKEVSLNPPIYKDSVYTWSLYDVLSLIKVIEQQKRDREKFNKQLEEQIDRLEMKLEALTDY